MREKIEGEGGGAQNAGRIGEFGGDDGDVAAEHQPGAGMELFADG